MKAAKGLQLEVGRPYREKDGALVLWYRVQGCEEDSYHRIDNLVHRLAKELFPVTTTVVEACLRSIADNLTEAGLLEGLEGNFGPIVQHIAKNSTILARLQAFVMGYYYNLLYPLLNVDQLSIPQALGSWNWSDIRMIAQVGNILSGYRIKQTESYVHRIKAKGIHTFDNAGRNFYKHGIIRLLAMFFAGAEEEQLDIILDGVVGVHGKLSLLNASLFGDIDTLSKAGMFFLMDIDPTCVPSTSRGIVTSSQRQDRIGASVIDSSGIENCDIDDLEKDGLTSRVPLTSHIEPDWDHDIQMTTVVFRYLGRFVRRINPIDCEHAISEDPLTVISGHFIGDTLLTVDALAHESLLRVRVPRSHEWTSGFIPGPILGEEGFDGMGPPTLISTGGDGKFRTCMRAWYWRNGFHALPFTTTYTHLHPFTDGCQVICAKDDREDDLHTVLSSKRRKRDFKDVEELLESNKSLCAVGRYVIIA